MQAQVKPIKASVAAQEGWQLFLFDEPRWDPEVPEAKTEVNALV